MRCFWLLREVRICLADSSVLQTYLSFRSICLTDLSVFQIHLSYRPICLSDPSVLQTYLSFRSICLTDLSDLQTYLSYYASVFLMCGGYWVVGIIQRVMRLGVTTRCLRLPFGDLRPSHGGYHPAYKWMSLDHAPEPAYHIYLRTKTPMDKTPIS